MNRQSGIDALSEEKLKDRFGPMTEGAKKQIAEITGESR